MQLTISKKYMTYELSSKLVEVAIEHAKKLEVSVCVAIVDSSGDLMAFGKMDDACLIGIGTAQGKAYTAARSGLNTREFIAYLDENKICVSALQNESLTLIAGGLPIFHENVLIGGIGIGGATGKQDEECAQVALQKLLD
ncbi:MAG TPA: heme-binding protein [Coxiellaceae bacterium]|nr:heme-binding protein [Coxiellaceae bacterium]